MTRIKRLGGQKTFSGLLVKFYTHQCSALYNVICCHSGSNFGVQKFSNQFHNFCFPLSQIMVMNVAQRRIKLNWFEHF